MPALVNSLTEIFDTAVARVRKDGRALEHLPRAVRDLEARLHRTFAEAKETDSVRGMLNAAMDNAIADCEADARPALQQEFGWLTEALGDYEFALTRPYFTLAEQDEPGSGGLLSITVNPNTCKGCSECIAVCEDDALVKVSQTADSVATLRRSWDFWLDLPSTAERHIRIDDLEERIGVLDNILLSKDVYLPFTSGDGACLGCSEKTVLHLFVATVEALMQPRVADHINYLTDLLARLERKVQLKLIEEIDVDDTSTLQQILKDAGGADLTLAELAERSEAMKGDQPIDQDWLARMADVIGRLKKLRWHYTEGTTGRGRAAMGILNATGCSSVWGSTFPYNPYPFPWANHLFQDSPSMALGIFEAHMAKMADGFKTIRLAELALDDAYSAAEHDDYLARFDWHQFSDDELHLCPPVVVVGGDGALYDIGFQNLSRALMSGKPLKIVALDTQVYSNTGGQACTSGFMGQISDMAAFGQASAGKEEVRKELGLIAMAHRTTYVMQSTMAYPSHMIEGFIEGLLSKRPALFNCYTSCQPEHGIGDDMGYRQAKLAVESRAYPLFRYDPDQGDTIADCLDLSGNPARDDDWPTYKLEYRDGGRDQSLTVAMTFADFAATETRFRKHFRTIPPDAWHENMLPVAEYLQLEADERSDK
ncbi:MAG: thiamine pyrophosphate-dependent enzyme, partial [Gammaproteobacteria bacterium]|nr:thiamine pyrophosphate-dependent enzyme [Gammaproteobacteria bacterium]